MNKPEDATNFLAYESTAALRQAGNRYQNLPNIQSGNAQTLIYDQSKYSQYKPWPECQEEPIKDQGKKIPHIAAPPKQVVVAKQVVMKP